MLHTQNLNPQTPAVLTLEVRSPSLQGNSPNTYKPVENGHFFQVVLLLFPDVQHIHWMKTQCFLFISACVRVENKWQGKKQNQVDFQLERRGKNTKPIRQILRLIQKRRKSKGLRSRASWWGPEIEVIRRWWWGRGGYRERRRGEITVTSLLPKGIKSGTVSAVYPSSL